MKSRILLAGMFAVLVTLTSGLRADDKAEKAETTVEVTAESSQAELEKAFTEQLSGATLVGHFTVDGREDNGGKPERYEIAKVSKLNGNIWIFNARIKYGDKDVTVPITLPVVWAGDTPMISMTNLTVPGMGTFTCRVIFYGDRYAGTWQHGKVGGHMWGKIEKAEEPSDDKKDAATGEKTKAE